MLSPFGLLVRARSSRGGKKSSSRFRPLGTFVAETLEARLPMHGSPQLQAEHAAAFALVDYAAVTHRAVKSGQWDDATTWDNGVPGEGANVLVPVGTTVLVDSQETAGELRTVRVDGKLQFATNVSTLLKVDTMVIDQTGTLEIGSAGSPVATNVTARIIVADRGAIDQTWDPRLLSRGIISHGTVTMYGADTTSHVALSQGPLAGRRTITLAQAPIGWEAGDELVLAGTQAHGNQDEALKIQSISGNTVTLTAALKYDHLPPAGMSVYVGNTTRNIRISSENVSTIAQRGHIMIMHALSVQIHDVEFAELGRTNKLKKLDNVMLDANGLPVANSGTNPVGRYPVHVHRVGTEPGGTAAVIEGSSVVGSPGWGMVNHSSNVDFTGNIVYDVVGAGFVTEVGDELGSFRGNFAIHSTGSRDNIRSRENIDDFGHQGHGFWFQGAGIEVTDNVAAGHEAPAFLYFTRGIHQDGVIAEFKSANLANPTIAGDRATIDIGDVPIRLFRNNVAFSSEGGFETWFHMRDATHNGRSIVENMVTWNTDSHGAKLFYTNQLTMKGGTLLGLNAETNTSGVTVNGDSRNLVFENVRIERWETGIELPEDGTNVVFGGTQNNVTDFTVPAAKDSNRLIEIRDVIFGNLDAATLAGRTEKALQVNVAVNLLDPDLPKVLSADELELGRILFGGQQVYLPEQAASFVPFKSGEAPAYVPAGLVGKTNQQLFDQYGLAVGGVLAPAIAAFDARVGALLGPTTTPLPTIKLNSAETVSSLSDYRLKYTNAEVLSQQTGSMEQAKVTLKYQLLY